MPPNDRKRGYRNDLLLASVLVAAGIGLSVVSLTKLAVNDANDQRMAQATPPLQSTPGAETKPSAPAEPTTTGMRPAGTAPEPAHPDAQAQKEFARYAAAKDGDPIMQARARRYLADPELTRETMAPAFSIRTVQGQTLDLDKLQGRVVLLHFWATDCNDCLGELSHVRQIVEKFQGKPLVVLSIGTDENPEKWRAFIEKYNMTWPQYWDADQEMAPLFGATTLPRYFTIDARGVLRSVVVGDNADIDRRLDRLVKQAEKTPQPAVTSSPEGNHR